MNNPKKVKITKASYALKTKTGIGPVEEKAISRAQKTMDDNNVDFQPMAKKFLAQLETAIQNARGNTIDLPEKLVRQMTEPVMQLKANAGMFKAGLISRLTNIMLDFLETVKTLDDDVIDIVEAHHNTLNLIISSKAHIDDGAHGAQLEKELKDACARYFAKSKAH